MVMQKTQEGTTPNGGVKATIFYQDDQGQPADESVATRALIVEYDDQGNSISRTYGTLGGASASLDETTGG